jgi:hypothetical protein
VIKGLIGRFGLATRIGAAIAAAVIAIQVLVTLVFLMHPPNFRPFYSARWLSGSSVEIIKNAMGGRRSRLAFWEICRTPNRFPFASTARRLVVHQATLPGR